MRALLSLAVSLPLVLAASDVAVFTVEDAPRYNAWPMIQTLGEKLVCAYSVGTRHSIGDGDRGGFVRVSADGGKTWAAETLLANDPRWGEVPEAVGRDKDGAMLLWCMCSDEKLYHHDLYRTDDGQSWTRLASLKLDPHPTQIMDVLNVDGRLVSLWFRCSYGSAGTNSWGTLESSDGGRTWKQTVVERLSSGIGLPTEQSVIYLGNGRFFGIARTEGAQGQLQIESVDGGRTWVKRPTNIKDVYCSTPALVYDSRSGLVYNYYYERGKGLLKRRIAALAHVSAAPDRWPEPEVLVTDDPVPPGADCGNVKVVARGDCHVAAYYIGKHPKTSIRVAVIRPYRLTTPRPSGTSFMHDRLKPFVDSGALPGAISVLCRDGVQETCCIGWSDVEKKRPIGMDDVFMQCSQTKGFCGVTVAKLVEEGRLGLDDPVAKYLPEFETLWIERPATNGMVTWVKAKNTLTVRMCMNHTGGFPFEICAKNHKIRGGGWSGGAPLRETARIAAANPLRFEPGTKMQYSNTGIDIAAVVVQTVTGLPWEEYLKKAVLDPLGMTSTTFWPTDEQLKTQIQMYYCHGRNPAAWISECANQQRPYNDGHVFPSAGAGLWTTANDQLRFYRMLMNRGVGDNGVRILKEETFRSLLAVSSRPKGLGGYSLGLTAPEVDGEDKWIGHGGAFGTNCSVNWHTRCLKLWIAQLQAGPRYWEGEAVAPAQDEFFSAKIDDSAVKAYTGRVK